MLKAHKMSLSAVFGAMIAAAAFAAPATAADKAVAVTAIVEHPALDALRDGVKEELKAQGFEVGKNLQ